MFTRTLSVLLVAALAMVLAPLATAVPVTVQYVDATTCDPLGNASDVHELGNGFRAGKVLFPQNESIVPFASVTTQIACPGSDTSAPNVMIRMHNFSGIDWAQLWYVADPDTTLSNVDGTVNAGRAFRIDNVGLNKPLFSEDITADGIFQAGEIWEFIIDDYSNASGGFASDFYSIGQVGLPSAGDALGSTGSIIAVAVPEPGSLVLLLLGTSSASLIIRIRLG